ncbi:MAG: chorismate mutase [Clostridia bacterium]|nr:chorismate mutase [Clostridia bacterium]
MEEQKDNLLAQAREEINAVDRQMAELFCRRFRAAEKVAAYKKSRGLPVLDPKREQEVIERNAALIEDETLRAYYVCYLRSMMALSRQYQHRLLEGERVAYSGVPGAFAAQAAATIFPDAALVPHADFAAAYAAVENGECECAVLPLENSIGGDVTQVMDLAFSGSLYVTGVYELEIEQNLLGVPGAEIADIRKVVSHSQALAQCAPYIHENGWEIEEAVNTAVAAKAVAQAGDKTVAAIATRESAQRYGLNVLASNIGAANANTTRFAVFSRVMRQPQPTDGRFLLFFTVRHQAGALGRAIDAIGETGFNLRALKSRPTKKTNWSYYFFAEGEGNLYDEDGQKMLRDLSKVCESLRVLGSYEKEISLKSVRADIEKQDALEAGIIGRAQK